MNADLEYIQIGMFTKFLPVTAAGEDAWREMAKADVVAAVLNHHAKSVIAQLRKAGYSVAKAKKVTAADMDSIFAELAELVA